MSNADLDALANIVTQRCGRLDRPVGVVLGTGLGEFAADVEQPTAIPFADLPGFPAAGVAGHPGRLVIGRIGASSVIVLQGRAHYYEHGEIEVMKTPIQLLGALGADTVLLTNAAGSLKPDAGPGSVMMIRDHINFTGVSPLFGERGSGRFVDMVHAYDPDLRQRFQQLAKADEITLHEGVYAYCCGPNFETPAEIHALGVLGADAVGMSTAPEVIVARQVGLRVAAMSIITNYAAGMDSAPLSHEHTLENATVAMRDARRLLLLFLSKR